MYWRITAWVSRAGSMVMKSGWTRSAVGPNLSSAWATSFRVVGQTSGQNVYLPLVRPNLRSAVVFRKRRCRTRSPARFYQSAFGQASSERTAVGSVSLPLDRAPGALGLYLRWWGKPALRDARPDNIAAATEFLASFSAKKNDRLGDQPQLRSLGRLNAAADAHLQGVAMAAAPAPRARSPCGLSVLPSQPNTCRRWPTMSCISIVLPSREKAMPCVH